jgi:hypothetical protein
MSSPAHRAALAFLRGGLVAVLSLVLAPALGAIAVTFPSAGWLVRATQFLLPVGGFAFGGAIGGEALDPGPRGALAFGCGGCAAGLVLLLTAPNLQGLTGFENPTVVVGYGVGSAAVAFAATGLIGSLIAGSGKIGRVTAGFAIGGAIGGLLGVAPFLVQNARLGLPPDLLMFVSFACAMGGVVVPFVAGGIVAALSRE